MVIRLLMGLDKITPETPVGIIRSWGSDETSLLHGKHLLEQGEGRFHPGLIGFVAARKRA